MQATGIEWTDFSANLLKYRDESGRVVWHCEKTSPGCAHCYSEAIAERFRKGGPFLPMVTPTVTPFFDEAEAAKILRSKKLAGKRVFVSDMTDLFGAWVPDEIIARHFAVFNLRPDVTFQVLTKRPERLWRFVGAPNAGEVVYDVAFHLCHGLVAGAMIDGAPDVWPLPNVHLGVSVEDQTRADERIPHLLRAPAAVRFLSCQPLLGPVDLTWWLGAMCPDCKGRTTDDECHRCAGLGWVGLPEGGCQDVSRIGWVIVGGESGPGARPCDVAWVRSLVGQCRAAGVPAFLKQLGGNVRDRNDAGFMGDPGDAWDLEPIGQVEQNPDGVLEEYQGAPVRIRLRDRKGGEPSEWPADLRVREFPHA